MRTLETTTMIRMMKAALSRTNRDGIPEWLCAVLGLVFAVGIVGGVLLLVIHFQK
jgi:hypothetical protein